MVIVLRIFNPYIPVVAILEYFRTNSTYRLLRLRNCAILRCYLHLQRYELGTHSLLLYLYQKFVDVTKNLYYFLYAQYFHNDHYARVWSANAL